VKLAIPDLTRDHELHQGRLASPSGHCEAAQRPRQSSAAPDTRIVPNVREVNLVPVIHEHVRLGSHIHTDALLSYRNLGKQGYRHSKVRHQIEEWVGAEGQTVNRIEGFWSMLKRGINATHIHVSPKHLPKYLGEFEYRWNMRHVPHLMLDRLMHSFGR